MTPEEFLKERLLVIPTCLFTGKGYEIITLTSIMQDYANHCTEQKLNIANVMQAEASASAEGAAVGNSADGQSGSVGCVHNTLKYIGPWYSCEDCGTHFNARAEAPPEGALPF